jgi:hypothetical protein
VPGWSGVWREAGPGARCENIWTAIDGVIVLDYRGKFVGLQIKGEACDVLGHEALSRIVRDLHGLEWRASRLDVAWDGFEIQPADLHDLLTQKHYVSRSKLDPWLMQHESGDTVYSHQKPMKRGIERWFRVYNKRGPVRFEYVTRKAHAAKLCHLLAGEPVNQWDMCCIKALRGFLDILDPLHKYAHQSNAYKRNLHPAWRQLVQSAIKWRPDMDTPKHRERVGMEYIGLVDGKIKQVAPWLHAAVEAFGEEYVIKRIKHHTQGREDELLTQQLQDCRVEAYLNKVADVPAADTTKGEIPF